MEFYWFERNDQTDESLFERVSKLKAAQFDGIMYPFSPWMGDYFTRVSRIFDTDTNFKYIISVRAYTISVQYLSMICLSMNNMAKDKIAINFLTGYINQEEGDVGGILSEINDHSSNIERSNYMLKSAIEFKKTNTADFFVTTTNSTVFEASTKNELPMILPYIRYKADWAKLNGQKVMLVMAPVFESPEEVDWKCDNENECRHPEGEACMDLEFFTKDSFFEFLDERKAEGIHSILFQESDYNVEQYEKIMAYIKEYKNL